MPSSHKQYILCRSTSFCRTIQSLRSILVGFLDITAAFESMDIPDIHTRAKPMETMYPQADQPCRALCHRRSKLLGNNFVSKNWDAFHEMESKFEAAGCTTAGQLNWFTIRDVLVARRSHGMPLPPGITQADIERLNAFSGWLWGIVFKDRILNTLAIGRFLGEMLRDIEASLEGKSSHSMLMYVGHDSTLVPLLCALGIYEG